MSNLTSLIVLNVSFNQLEVLPDVTMLPVLKHLFISHNRVRKVPDTLLDMPTLQKVDLSFNRLELLPAVKDAEKLIRHLTVYRFRYNWFLEVLSFC